MSVGWPLPETSFVPGQTVRPSVSPVFEAAASAPPLTDPALWRENATYLYGCQLYTAGFFWEAHEVWEPVWMHAPPNSHARALIQGLIQLANACLKIRMARPHAARRLLAMSRAHIEEAGYDPVMGLDPATLHAQISAFEASATLDLTIRPAIVPK